MDEEYEEGEPFSEEEAKAEYDEWMKQSIMDDKAQQKDKNHERN